MYPARKAFEDHLCKLYTKQDPSGFAVKELRSFFDGLSDRMFRRYIEELRSGRQKLPFYQVPFKNPIKPEDSFAAADFLGLKTHERVYLWDPVGKRYALSPEEYPVLHVPVRRLKQHREDSLSVPESDKHLSPLTNQVIGPDKGSTISYPQMSILVAQQQVPVLDELMTVRSGDIGAYAQFTRMLEETGEANVSDVTDYTGVRSAQVVRTILRAMHIDSNI